MLEFIKETKTVWERIKETGKHIVLYGMGNGADKILDWCGANGVKVSGVFASDEFVRGQQFRGFTVEKYDELIKRLGGDIFIVIAFASERPEVLERFRQLASRHETAAPHMSLYPEEETVSLRWLERHESELRRVYSSLADDLSRKVFADTLNYKISGNIGYLFGCATERRADLEELLQLGSSEIYMDLGAYSGDTVREFLELTGGRCEEIIAVEPDRRNFRKLKEWAQQQEQDIEALQLGIWDCRGELEFSDSGGRQSTFMEGGRKTVPVDSIDNIAGGRKLTYIKMDVEGAEARAIKGGGGQIAANRPQLFIAAYHYDNDIFRLPLLLWQLAPDYRIYLRKHPYVPAWELNFICTAG